MKQPIEWHEECSTNIKATIDRYKEEVTCLLARAENLKVTIKDLETEVTFYGKQIEAAKILGKDGFDRERFFINKKEGTENEYLRICTKT